MRRSRWMSGQDPCTILGFDPLNHPTHTTMCLAVPGKIISISGDDEFLRSGRVSFSGIVKEVNLAYTPEAKIGDYVIVHVGFALSTVDEEEARLVFGYLKEMGDLAELEDEAPGRPA